VGNTGTKFYPTKKLEAEQMCVSILDENNENITIDTVNQTK
jgi:hypothetical protein